MKCDLPCGVRILFHRELISPGPEKPEKPGSLYCHHFGVKFLNIRVWKFEEIIYLPEREFLLEFWQ